MSIEITTKFTNALYETMSEFDDKIADLALRFQLDVIAPFCEKFNVKFLAGNGVCSFQRIDTEELIDDDDLDDYFCGDREHIENDLCDEFWQELNDIYAVLNFEIYDTKLYYSY